MKGNACLHHAILPPKRRRNVLPPPPHSSRAFAQQHAFCMCNVWMPYERHLRVTTRIESPWVPEKGSAAFQGYTIISPRFLCASGYPSSDSILSSLTRSLEQEGGGVKTRIFRFTHLQVQIHTQFSFSNQLVSLKVRECQRLDSKLQLLSSPVSTTYLDNPLRHWIQTFPRDISSLIWHLFFFLLLLLHHNSFPYHPSFRIITIIQHLCKRLCNLQ